jgi:ATP-dependent RNA helicase DDX54/DBP10
LLLLLLLLWLLLQNEVALAEFTAKLRSFRPTATVLEAEIAKVRPSMGGPTMATQLEAARMYKSNEVMGRKRSKHAHIIERERLKQRLEGGGGGGLWEGEQGGSRRGGGGDEQLRDDDDGDDEQMAAAAGSDDDGSGGPSLDDDDDGEGDGSDDDDGDGEEEEQEAKRRRKSGKQASSSSGGGKRSAAAMASAYGDGQLATGRYRDADFFVSHTREGRTHNEDLGLDREQVQLQGAVLDLQGEDQGALRAQQRQYRWEGRRGRGRGGDARKGRGGPRRWRRGRCKDGGDGRCKAMGSSGVGVSIGVVFFKENGGGDIGRAKSQV